MTSYTYALFLHRAARLPEWIFTVGMLREAQAGVPSAVTMATGRRGELKDDEIRERMAGNICRCGAYPNIIAAIHGRLYNPSNPIFGRQP